MAERLAVNEDVLGSSPSSGAIMTVFLIFRVAPTQSRGPDRIVGTQWQSASLSILIDPER